MNLFRTSGISISVFLPIDRDVSGKNKSSQLQTENLAHIITSEGGVVSGEDVLLKIPPEAVGRPVYVQVTKEDPSKYYGPILQKDLENDVRVCAPILRLQPSGYRFIKPVKLSATYRVNDCKGEDFLILHGTEKRDGKITWHDVTQNSVIERTFTSVLVTTEIRGFIYSVGSAIQRLNNRSQKCWESKQGI